MKIKIKVKQLILITLATIFAILFVVPFTTLEIAKYLDKKGSDKAAIFYESYLGKAIKPSEGEALYKYALNIIGNLDRYYIMSNFSGGDRDTADMENIERAISYLETILKKSDGSINKEVYKSLLDTSIATLKNDKLVHWISWGKDKESEIKYISDIYEAYYLFVNGEYDLANEVLDKYEIKDRDDMYYIIKSYIAEFDGDLVAARDYYDRIDMNYYDEILFGRPYYGRRYKVYNSDDHSGEAVSIENLENVLGQYKLRGKVTYNGKPMPFVEVYMNAKLNSFSSTIMNFVGITDINGEYESIGLKKGKYNVGIGINNSVLYNKVFKSKANHILEFQGDTEYNFEFTDPIKVYRLKNNQLITEDKFTVEWEEVENAEYYIIEMTSFTDKERGSSVRHAIPDENRNMYIYDNKAIFDINILKNYISGSSHEGEEGIITPYSILGVIRPDIDSPITVTAYDKEGSVLGSSLPINTYYENIPSIKIKREFTEGEKLILAKKHEEAISYYEDILVKDPNNLEALKYLIKYYIMGWKMDVYDFDKALVYANRYLNITGDNALLKSTIGHMNYTSLIKHKDFIIEFYSNIFEAEKDTDYYWHMGRFYTALGDIEKARSYYENMKKDFIDVRILEFDLYLNDIEKAISRLKTDGFNTNLMNKNILLNAISNFDDNVLKSDDYKIFMELLEDSIMNKYKHEEMQSKFYNSYNRIKNQDIKVFLDEWKIENYWTRM